MGMCLKKKKKKQTSESALYSETLGIMNSQQFIYTKRPQSEQDSLTRKPASATFLSFSTHSYNSPQNQKGKKKKKKTRKQ
jgi:hypothetical protein